MWHIFSLRRYSRESAYTGNTITWDEISAAALDYLPEKLELGKMDMSKYTVPFLNWKVRILRQ